MRTSIALVVCVVGANSVYARDEDPKRWVGNWSVITEYDIPIVGNNDKVLGKIDGTRVTVTRVQGRRVFARDQRGQEGWVPADKLIPLPEAIAYFTRRIGAEPNNDMFYYLRATSHRLLGDPASAVRDATDAIRLKPESPTYYNSRGLSHEELKQYDKAAADFGEYIRLSPKSFYGWFNRGNIRAKQQDAPAALADYAAALELERNYPDVYAFRANVYLRQKDYARALTDLDEACRLDPKHRTAFHRRAWLLATCSDAKFRDGKKALMSATRACDITDWKNAACVEGYAAAMAENGKFDDAVKWATKAIEFAGTDAERTAMRSRLALYKDKKPFRE